MVQYANEYHNSSYPSQASYADPVAQDWHDPSYPTSQASPVDPLAQVLQAQRRRGREDRMPAPNVIEVKQADLTGGRKLREDQIRTTGIAFGPAYQVKLRMYICSYLQAMFCIRLGPWLTLVRASLQPRVKKRAPRFTGGSTRLVRFCKIVRRKNWIC